MAAVLTTARPHGGAASAQVCGLAGYKAGAGLVAEATPGGVVLAWNGDSGRQLRLGLAIVDGTPTIREWLIRSVDGAWIPVAKNVTADYRLTSGLRRMTNQQLDPLAGAGVAITPEILERDKWEAFWDAPLNIPGNAPEHNDTTPPQRGVLSQPGLPRRPEEVKRVSAVFTVERCEVKTDGSRIEVSFPGVRLGDFSGKLMYTVYTGTNLIRQEIVATTNVPSVAYKYDAGLKGIAVTPASRMVWRDLQDRVRDHRFTSADTNPVVVLSNHRVEALEVEGAALAAFPPPHTFFWARESSANLGYNWYRQDTPSSLSFGIRQAEAEKPGGEGAQNFALYSARPGSEQRMPVYFYPDIGEGAVALDHALAFTRGDHFKAVPGYQVMATHFHMGMLRRIRADGTVPDLELMKAAGITIAAPIDGGGAVNPAGTSEASSSIPGIDDPKWFHWSRGLGAPPDLNIYGDTLGTTFVAQPFTALVAGPRTADERPAAQPRPGGSTDPYASQARYYDVATRLSNASFVVMPNAEILRGEVARSLGGHSDVLFSHPVYWTQGRAPGQPFVEPDAKYGKVYHVGSTADMMELTRVENLLVFMPHPRSKGSTGFPDAIKDTPHFLDPNYRGFGFRWGMGLDGSERRLCEYRCQALFDDMNNWVADRHTPPKYIQAISELYAQDEGDDVYANNPVNYVKIGPLPPPGSWRSIIDAMKAGDYFVTSGEVLITNYEVRGSGAARVIVADVEWTFPLDFVELVWGDGRTSGREIVRTTDLAPFGTHHFEIPFEAAGRKWVRFAAWDSAGNGAMVQPVSLADAAVAR